MIQKLNTEEEYYYWLKRGIDPLFFNRYIKLEISLRIKLQYELFGYSELGHKSVLKANDKYYHYCYEKSLKTCENCGKSLYSNRNIDKSYSAIYISHILSRGSNAAMAHDPRNHNILCFTCHNAWENSPKETILYLDNLEVIRELKSDYYNN